MIDLWSLERGATPGTDGSTRFSVWAPAAHTVEVAISRRHGKVEEPLERRADGVYEGVVPGVPAGADYYYRLDGSQLRPDPVSRQQPEGVHGPSRVVDPNAHAWQDSNWPGLTMADLVLYELHIGTFDAEGTFDAVIPHLPYLRDLGVTAIELMPVAQFPGRRNWGYDGVHPYAPQNAYGGPHALRRLVEAAHLEGLGVVLDVVYNHLGPEGNYLAEFGPYFTERYGTPWGKAVNFDGPDSDEVRRYFIDNALYWITEYHIDGLRLDAVQTIFDFSALHILEELATAVHAQADALGRRALIIAESDLNDPRLVRPHSRGGYGLDAAWNDDFHHAVHAILTGEQRGYYVDFGDLECVTRVMRDRFVLDGRYSAYRRRRHGASASDVPGDRFVAFIQNHDQVGNRARGERLNQLVSFAQRKLAAALLLLSPYVPLLFMGEEYGDSHPFLYFVDHGDADLLEAVRQGRQKEFSPFDWEGPIPDPGAEETFLRSFLDREQIQSPPHSCLFHLYRDLIHLRREEPALTPGVGMPVVQRHPQSGWISLLYETHAPNLLAAFNFSPMAGVIELRMPPGAWLRLFASDEEKYGGGEKSRAPKRIRAESGEVVSLTLASYSAALYRRESD